MAQSAGLGGGKNPLGITGFWPAKCTEPPMMWEFWINRFQWGMVAKHSLNPMNFYFAANLTAAQITDLPAEVDGKNRRESEMVLIWNLYLCLGEKGQDELHKRRPHLDLQTIRYPRMIDALETEFKKERNETYETCQLLSRKQFINESLEQFHSVLSGLAARCIFGILEDRILRDVFIVNMNNRDAQKELCRSTKTPEEVYRIALSYERGSKYASSYVATGSAGTPGSSSGGGGIPIKSEPVGIIRGGYRNNRSRGRGSYQGRGSYRGRNPLNNNKCYNCDQQNFTREHLDRCPAKGVTCNFCHKIGHFERTCRGKRENQRGQGAVGMIRENVDDHQLENSADEEASQHASSIGWVNKNPVVHSWDSSSSDGDYMVMAIKRRGVTELKVAGAQLPIKVNGKPKSPISIFTIGELRKTLGTSGVKLDNLTEEDNAFRDYGNNPLQMIGTMAVTIQSNGWKIQARIKVIGGNRPSIIGRGLMPQLGLQLVQQTPGDQIMSIGEGSHDALEPEGELDSWQTYFSKQFSNLFSRVGKIRNYKVAAEFYENLTPVQQKGRRVPISLQEKVDAEIDKLLKQGHIEKLPECSDKYFVSPIVITVKKDGSVKLALESRELNKQVHKNKYQMPNIEELMDTVGQTISEKKQGDVYFTTMDLTYAYGQLPLNAETSIQCNFSLIGGRSTGTYRFKTGFYGLTTMPAEFQRAMDCILAEYPQAHAFIDDILVVTKGTAVDHIATVEKILKKLDRENMSLKLTKCKFAQRECEWLGHKITPTGITPLVRKTEPIEALTPPRTLSQLKSFMGSIHSLHKYLPALAESSAPLRPLLSKNNEYIWTPECQNAFENPKKQVSNIVELRHFDIHKDIRIVCDASHNGLGAVLEQLGPEGWRPISFASRYLNEAEKKYSTNELEMLAVVWGAE